MEDAIYHIDGVAEAVVFSVPDERLGETVGAVVVVHPTPEGRRPGVDVLILILPPCPFPSSHSCS